MGAKLFVDTAKEYLNEHKVSTENIGFLRNAVPIIKAAIESHMGQFNTAPYAPDVVLPKPDTQLQQFVHLLDLLGSRKFLIFDFDVYEEVDR